MSDELKDKKETSCNQCGKTILLVQQTNGEWKKFEMKQDGSQYIIHSCSGIKYPEVEIFQKANEMLESGEAVMTVSAMQVLITEVTKIVHLCEQILKAVEKK